MFIEDYAKIASRVNRFNLAVLKFAQLLLESDKKKFGIEVFKVSRFAVVQEEICCRALRSVRCALCNACCITSQHNTSQQVNNTILRDGFRCKRTSAYPYIKTNMNMVLKCMVVLGAFQPTVLG